MLLALQAEFNLILVGRCRTDSGCASGKVLRAQRRKDRMRCETSRVGVLKERIFIEHMHIHSDLELPAAVIKATLCGTLERPVLIPTSASCSNLMLWGITLWHPSAVRSSAVINIYQHVAVHCSIQLRTGCFLAIHPEYNLTITWFYNNNQQNHFSLFVCI